MSGENLAIFGILVAFYAAFYAQSQFELSCWSMMQLEESRIDGDLRLLATKDVVLEIQKTTLAQYSVGNTTLESLRTILEALIETREVILAQRSPVSFNFSLFGSNGGNSVSNAKANDE